MAEPLVLIHGFGGTHRAWDQVVEHLPPERYRPVVRPDLPGHGARGKERPITFESCVEAVLADAPPEPVTLVGYSLGGRIAQLVALTAPERVRRLVLVSTTAGIEDEARRRDRTAADDALARQIAQMSPDQFADRWTGQAIFADTSERALDTWRTDLVRSDPAALSVALSALSTGRMPPLWDRITELSMPITLVAGDRDPKFVRFAERYQRRLPAAELIVLSCVGHGLPREAPGALADVLSAAA